MDNKQSKSSKSLRVKRRPAAKVVPKRTTKLGIVIRLLQRKDGATLGQLANATQWQRHTVRSVLSRSLANKGFTVTSSKPKDGAVRTYRIADAKTTAMP